MNETCFISMMVSTLYINRLPMHAMTQGVKELESRLQRLHNVVLIDLPEKENKIEHDESRIKEIM